LLVVDLMLSATQDYTPSNDWTMNWKGCCRKWSRPNLRYHLGNCLDGLRKMTKHRIV